MPRLLRWFLFIAGLAFNVVRCTAQQSHVPAPLDLTGDITSPLLESSLHHPLSEQYIWSPNDKDGTGDSPVYFREEFDLAGVPSMATIYVAGPDRLRVFVNGRLLANAERNPRSRLKPLVLGLWVAYDLRPGRNTVAVEASHGGPLGRDHRLIVKIVPRIQGLEAPPEMISDGSWKCSDQAESGWEQPGYNDGSWSPVRNLGGVMGNIDYRDWNADAGMYQWPGYEGIAPYLAHLTAPVERIIDVFDGLGRIDNAESIAPIDSARSVGLTACLSTGEFAVILPPATATREEYPDILLDFGRESAGRIELVSDSDAPATVEIQYGESRQEAVKEPYLGVISLVVPPHAIAHGPKSAFRYALIRFLRGNSPMRFKAIQFDSIYYPVKYQGSFESSDPLLNDIWRVGAYTAHLTMQDQIWDAPKRDRAPYAGDLNVSGRVIDTVFADHDLMQKTMGDVVPWDSNHHVNYDVNGIPGYTAFWVMDQADFYRHLGDTRYLQSIRQPLTELLDYMIKEMDDHYLHVNPKNTVPGVDWSPDMFGETLEVRRAHTLEFAKGFAEGAWLLSQLGDTAGTAKYSAETERIQKGAQKFLVDPATGTFGTRWQPNAMAIFSGVADAKQTEAIWDKVLSRPRHYVISPYYNFYVITAMAASGHRKEALDWIREYWGGMIKEGATSFWEVYDPDWDKSDFHANLQFAGLGEGGYFVSLCHGWSSGATAWLTEQVLGIEPQGAGFSRVSIRPDLAGLEWARGAEPTPQGPIAIDLRRAGAGLEARLTLPPGVDAEISMPASSGSTAVQVNGQSVTGRPAENGARLVIELSNPGAYELETK